MEEIVFEKKVSKGSKFNQIYIPKEIKEIVEVGDLVQVRLLEKHKELYYKKNIEKLLIKNFNQKVHVLLFNEKKLRILMEKDPITRVMLNNYISNKKINLDYKKKIDEKHVMFLLMMPEDLLELRLPSKIFYDNLRRLIAIEEFLRNKDLGRQNLLNKIKKEINIKLLDKIKNNKEINDEEIEILRRLIRIKIKNIK